jgi:hypothetical protein
MKQGYRLLAAALFLITLGACSHGLPSAPRQYLSATPEGLTPSPTELRSDRSHAKGEVFSAAGDIRSAVDNFRAALGDLNANVPGSANGGRREINWDAVPAQFTNTNDFPADFFNQPVVGRARGTEFLTRGTGFRTSDNNFADVKPDFDGPFEFFSPIRTFAPVGSDRMSVDLFVPGSKEPATSTGFGVVFSDVDRRGSASIQLFDARGRSLGRYEAPVAPGGLSFIGVRFADAVVASVEIRSGQAAVVTDGTDLGDRVLDPKLGHGEKDDDDGDDDHDHGKGHHRSPDLVIMDDFIYGEPKGLTVESVTSAPVSAGGVQGQAH